MLGDGLRIELLDVKVVRILCNVKFCRIDGDTVLQLDQAIRLQEKQSSCLICCIVRDCNHISVRHIVKAGLCSRIDAERLVMDVTCIDQVCSVLFVECIQIIDVLEVVCIKLSALHHIVRLNIIVEYSVLKIVPLRLQQRLCKLQDLCMRCRGRCNGNLLEISGCSLC